MEAGADDYLVKPFDNNELKVRLGPGCRILELQRELLRAQEQLREQATRDSLTRLWNRHAIWDILLRELSRSYREQIPLGIVMGDLDNFKAINDQYGHVSGDSVLREISSRIQGSVRTYDAVGRYGGEEFLIILPGCDDSTAFQTAERIRNQIQSTPVKLPEGALTVTASFGVTSLPRGVRSEPEPIVRLADEALYAAKDKGRNQTSVLAYPTHLFALK
jgi:diguanylate cyclase (GGDEF)-like protein